MKKSVMAVAVLAAGFAGGAAAEDTGFYVGGSVGWAYAEGNPADVIDDEGFDQFGDFNFDDDDFGYKLYAGWQILPILAVEAGYVDFGEIEDDTPISRTRVTTDAWDAFVVGNLPLGFFDIFAKVGVVSYDVDYDVDGGSLSFSDDDSGTDPAYGLGAAVEVGSFAVRGEWEYFDVSGLDDLSLFSVGLTYQF